MSATRRVGSYLSLLVWLSALPAIAVGSKVDAGGGYVVGNFGISAQIDESHGIRARIKINPPQLGKWLQEFAEAQFLIETVPSRETLSLELIDVSRTFPQYRATFRAAGGAIVDVNVFAPLGLESNVGFLPALITRVRVHADSHWRGRLVYKLRPHTPAGADVQRLRLKNLSAVIAGPAFLGMSSSAEESSELEGTPAGLTASAIVALSPGAARELTFVAGSYDANGYYANESGSAAQLVESVATRAKLLERGLQELVALLPVTGDRSIDEYLRWYSSAAILLTKGIRTGEVLTMGYRELNQRDSFWSSGIHLVFWPDLEKKMLLETAQAQLPSGRIPVTILPVIDRGDELDSAEYFVLRAARYYRWHRDPQLLAEIWPALKKAVAYLDSRDLERVGVPMQTSYWADWKDVRSVEGRTYAPHFALLWLATLKSASELAAPARDPEARLAFERMGKRAAAFINRPFDEGGMWNGTNYVDRWQDGRRPDYVLMDQLVGAYFQVIDRERLQSIYRKVQANESAYGVRETFPYAPYSSGYRESEDIPGNYHNGGVWPWINWMDVTSRYALGRARDAERIIRKVGKADLEAGGDFQPGEFMNGDSGRNLGFPIQAWNAALFSAIYFGAFGLERVSDTEIAIRVRTPKSRDFSTPLVLPETTGTLSSISGKLAWTEDSTSRGHSRIKVRVFDERPE